MRVDVAKSMEAAAQICGCSLSALAFVIAEMDDYGNPDRSVFSLAMDLHQHRHGPDISHVPAETICEAATKLAKHRYGMLAHHVLDHIGIRSTADIGKIIFALIEVGFLKAGPEDNITEFNEALDWKAALDYSEDLKAVEID